MMTDDDSDGPKHVAIWCITLNCALGLHTSFVYSCSLINTSG